jgi:dephospho-CoA kinase
MIFRVGLTGGIASGKSAVSACFEQLGVPVIDTDVLAREAVAPGSDGLAAVAARFGDGILQADGSLDRRALRTIVFTDPKARQDLESIVHPRIHALLAARIGEVRAPYCVLAIPLLVEGGRIPVDRILVVDCPREVQLTRLLARDGETQAGAEAILAAQASREARIARADDLIDNTGSLASLGAKVQKLHEQYLVLATAHRNRAEIC